MMGENLPVIFRGVVAYILLLLYASTVINMTKAVILHGVAEAPKDENGKTLSKKPLEFPAGTTYIVTMIGGLVSALVVAKLTITKPKTMPTVTLPDAPPWMSELFTFLTGAYLVGWVVIGLAALIVGVMVFPDSNAILGEMGTTWLGLAVASGYAYFNLDPQSGAESSLNRGSSPVGSPV
jgi:hypothetical protein